MSIFDRFRLDGKKLFITGGSRGLGLEMALAIADAGADVVLVARNSDQLKKASDDIQALGRKVWTIQKDVSIPEECEEACQIALNEVGPVDILINNVGGRRVNIPTEEMPLSTWQELIDLNLTNTFICSKIIGGAMIENGLKGRIINVASINGLVAGRNIAGRHYETAKAGVIQLTRSLAVDWAPHGITVNAICPGLFMTAPNQAWSKENPKVIEDYLSNVPVGCFGEPEDIGPLAVYLASDSSRYMTGSSMIIDGGYTCW